MAFRSILEPGEGLDPNRRHLKSRANDVQWQELAIWSTAHRSHMLDSYLPRKRQIDPTRAIHRYMILRASPARGDILRRVSIIDQTFHRDGCSVQTRRIDNGQENG